MNAMGRLRHFGLTPIGGPFRKHSGIRCSQDNRHRNPWAAQILVSPDGAQLFVSERRTHILTRWKLDPGSGRMSKKVTIDVARNPRGFDIDPIGRILVLAGLEDDRVEYYSIENPNLPPEKVHDLPTLAEPGWVEILPAKE